MLWMFSLCLKCIDVQRGYCVRRADIKPNQPIIPLVNEKFLNGRHVKVYKNILLLWITFESRTKKMLWIKIQNKNTKPFDRIFFCFVSQTIYILLITIFYLQSMRFYIIEISNILHLR